MSKVLSVSREEIGELAELANEVWHEFFPCILTLEQIDYMVEKFQSRAAMTKQVDEGYEYYFITLENGERAGYIGIHDEGSKLFLSKLYLKKNHRGKGLASVAFDFLDGLCAERGIKELYLTVNRRNHGAIAVYKAKGMEIVREQVCDIGNGFVMDDYVFSKEYD